MSGGRKRLPLHRRPIALDYLPVSASSSGNKTARLWDTATGALQQTSRMGGRVNGLESSYGVHE
ncbi:hypothetical protein N7449_008247 [Penicillium cf. viridicatum]|uniref:Uncharacterized protein n=1 Tax=Penicillium cf. viridicatum TaxID=2972119 RepID=A0A9W9JBX7_9EURO|nr:hypothetical protein N7449_008247 [Penicillium cf. viridicatum]